MSDERKEDNFVELCSMCSFFSKEHDGEYPVFDCPHMKGIKHWDIDRAAYCKHFNEIN